MDIERASATCSVGTAVSKCLSYVTIPNFATLEERCVLQDAALGVQQDALQNGDLRGIHVLAASESNKNCTRYSVEALLNTKAKAMSAIFLDRLLSFLEGQDDGDRDEQMSDLALQIFGFKSNLRKLKVEWYAEPDECGQLIPEPKVNIYQEGGFFLRHGDGMHLTLLVVLSDDYEGGGTAFFKEPTLENEEVSLDDEQNSDLGEGAKFAGIIEPDCIAKPPAGTAMIWGATLDHMALPVTKGTRAVYVGSFDLRTAEVEKQ